jgi:hypothetical protein
VLAELVCSCRVYTAPTLSALLYCLLQATYALRGRESVYFRALPAHFRSGVVRDGMGADLGFSRRFLCVYSFMLARAVDGVWCSFFVLRCVC